MVSFCIKLNIRGKIVKIAKIKGIEIKLHLSTLLIIGLVGFYATSFYVSLFPQASLIELIIIGLVNGLIILLSILIHEISHSLVAQKYGLGVSEIELYLFGGVSKIEEEPKTPKSEIIIAIVGPLSSLLIGGSMFLVLFLPLHLNTIISITLFYSGISNIGLGIFNLLPAFPIDGGRVLRALLWRRRKNLISATRSASKMGVFFGYGLMAYGVLQIFTFGLIGGLWLIIIGSYLKNSARQSYVQILNDVTLSKLSVREILSLPKLRIPFNTSISDAIKEYFIPYNKSYFPVIRGNEIIGIVHSSDIQKISKMRRSEYIVGYIMRRLSEFNLIDDDRNGKDAMLKLSKLDSDPRILIVKDKKNNNLIGFLGEDEIISSLKINSLN